MYKNFHNILNFIEGSIAVTALVGIFAFTFLGAFSINPISEANPVSGNVAGINTVNSLEWQNNYSYPGHQVDFKTDQKERITTFEIVPKNFKEGILDVNLAEITNNSIETKRMKASLQINGPVLDAIEVYLLDNTNVIPLYQENNSINYEIIIEPNSTKILTAQYDVAENINFPFQLNFSFQEF